MDQDPSGPERLYRPCSRSRQTTWRAIGAVDVAPGTSRQGDGCHPSAPRLLSDRLPASRAPRCCVEAAYAEEAARFRRGLDRYKIHPPPIRSSNIEIWSGARDGRRRVNPDARSTWAYDYRRDPGGPAVERLGYYCTRPVPTTTLQHVKLKQHSRSRSSPPIRAGWLHPLRAWSSPGRPTIGATWREAASRRS